MDIQPQTTQPISDDQELAKVLAGINSDAGAAVATPEIETTAPAGPPPPAPTQDHTVAAPVPIMPPVDSGMPMPSPQPEETAMAPSAPNGELDNVKLEAINELRPLVDKLNLAPEEKFDTYLLLIRSTDDRSLVAPAHDAAKAIADETRRAQALLDIIKEIDFLSGQQPVA